MTILNLIVAEQLTQFYNDVQKEIGKGAEKKIAVVNVLRKYIKDSKKVRFEGDGYSDGMGNRSRKKRADQHKGHPEGLGCVPKGRVPEVV